VSRCGIGKLEEFHMKLLKPKSFKEFKEKERELENQAKKPKRNKVFNAI
jgi:hypothetical protein